MNPQAATFIEQDYLLLENMISADELTVMGEIYDACFEQAEQRRGFKGLGGADAQGRQTLPQIVGPSEEHPALVAQDQDYWAANRSGRAVSARRLCDGGPILWSLALLRPRGNARGCCLGRGRRRFSRFSGCGAACAWLHSAVSRFDAEPVGAGEETCHEGRYSSTVRRS